MKITEANFRLFAAKHYDNPYCLNETEFESDLFKASVAKKLVTNHVVLGKDNLKLLVNTLISFFNVFEHHAAARILEFRLHKHQVEYINAALLYLSLPLVEPQEFNTDFLIEIRNTYA